MTLTGTETYYRQRAREYDQIYTRSERQPNLRTLEHRISRAFEGLDVLELAAGTGYWTRFLSERARSIVATDINDAVLDIARARQRWTEAVEFREASAFQLREIHGRFNAAFAGFFWSHVPLERIDEVLERLSARLEAGSRVIFLDNRFVEGSSTPISRTDAAGNTYQTRSLDDGTTWEVLKNFPGRAELSKRLEEIADHLEIDELDYFWIAELRTRPVHPATKGR